MKISLNKKQYFILCFTALVIAAMCLFPPFTTMHRCYYNFIFDEGEGRIDFVRLSLQTIAVLLTSSVLVKLCSWTAKGRAGKTISFILMLLLLLAVIVALVVCADIADSCGAPKTYNFTRR